VAAALVMTVAAPVMADEIIIVNDSMPVAGDGNPL